MRAPILLAAFLASPWSGLGQATDECARALAATRALAADRSPAEALPAARRSSACAPESPEAALLLARLLARLGAYQPALEEFARARALFPVGTADLSAWVAPALVLRDQGRVDEALDLLLAAPRRTRDVAEALGLLLLATGKPSEAGPVAAAALADAPDSATLHFVRGMAAAAAADRDAAIADLERCLALDLPDPGRAQLELATLLGEAGRHHQAEAAFAEAERLTPTLSEVWFRRANWLRQRGMLEPARAALERHQSLRRLEAERAERTRRHETTLAAAALAATENQLDRALSLLATARSQEIVDPRAAALAAKVLYSLRRVDDALAALEPALAAAPGVVEHHYLNAILLRGSGRPAAAEAALARALALDPDLAEAWALLAVLAADSGRYQESTAHYRRALALGLDTRALRLGHAAVLERLGRSEEAARERAAAPP